MAPEVPVQVPARDWLQPLPSPEGAPSPNTSMLQNVQFYGVFIFLISFSFFSCLGMVNLPVVRKHSWLLSLKRT